MSATTATTTSAARHFVMPESEWLALCMKQCRARRKLEGNGDCERDGLCPECVDDAADRVPKKYLTSESEADGYDRLPGIVA